MTGEPPLLELRDLSKEYSQTSNIIDELRQKLFSGEVEFLSAVDSVDLSLEENQIQGIIGESGCGKTTLLETISGLIKPTSGEIYFKGNEISGFTAEQRREFNQKIQLIFQDPFNSINPKFTVEEALAEQVNIYGLDDREERITDALEMARLTPAKNYLRLTPDRLSGGEKQRVSIARALVPEPDLILADEMVSMLDVSTQAAILNLMDSITEDTGASMLYISHDLSTVSHLCDIVNVMYLGRIVESSSTLDVISDPKHPYTKELIKAIPIPDPTLKRERSSLKGTPGDAINLPGGCRFKDRCPERMDICDEPPEFVGAGKEGHKVACHLHYDHKALVDQVAVGGSE